MSISWNLSKTVHQLININSVNSVNSVNSENSVNSVNSVNRENSVNNVNSVNRENSVNTVNCVQAVYSAVLPPYQMVLLSSFCFLLELDLILRLNLISEILPIAPASKKHCW